jgi:hypothetical protein
MCFRINVQLADLLGGGGSELGGLPGWLTVFLVILTLGILLALMIALCIRKNLFCFDRKDSDNDFWAV